MWTATTKTGKRTLDLAAWHECNCRHTSRTFQIAWSLPAGLTGDMEKEPATKHQTPQKSHQTFTKSRHLWNKWATGQAVSNRSIFFFLRPQPTLRRVTCSSTLTLIASDFCWQDFHCWLRDNKAVHWEPGPNNCIVHVQALSWGQPEYYSELLPSFCPLLLCLYGELLIVWQDWQAPLQSWLKALRSEKWDRYRANTCTRAVSPTGCALHWHRINGSIKKPT